MNLPIFDLQRMMCLIPALLIAFTIHEAAHGLIALAAGDATAKRDGRISLNPIRHIDPLGFVFILVAGFGWAKPVMVDPYYLKNPKWDMAMISLAGPMSNLVLAFIGAMVFVPMFMLGVIGVNSHGFMFLNVFIQINIVLAVFNLLPVPPLDGSKILTFWLPDNAYDMVHGQLARFGFPILLIAMFLGVTRTVIFPAVQLIFTFMVDAADNIWRLIL